MGRYCHFLGNFQNSHHCIEHMSIIRLSEQFLCFVFGKKTILRRRMKFDIWSMPYLWTNYVPIRSGRYCYFECVKVFSCRLNECIGSKYQSLHCICKFCNGKIYVECMRKKVKITKSLLRSLRSMYRDGNGHWTVFDFNEK